MIILFHPRAVKPRSRRLPLAVLALAAVLEGLEEYEIVDGNVDDDPLATTLDLIDTHKVELLGVSVMPGPQMVAGMEVSREVRRLRPHIRIAWGGYFPSIYPEATLNARYVDYAVLGQGEDTLLELIAALRGQRPFDSILGLCLKDQFGFHRTNAERPMRGPDSFPWSPFHRLPVEKYLRPPSSASAPQFTTPASAARSTAAFCGVHAAYGRAEKFESPERTDAILRHLVENYGADSVQFYDMNFFLREDHARELMDRIAPLNLRWWCEARVDIMSRYSDETMQAIKRAGCAMIFFGAESGSDWALRRDAERHHHRTDADDGAPHARVRHHPGVLLRYRQPERSGTRHARDPALHPQASSASIRTPKSSSSTTRPRRSRRPMYGEIDGKISFPDSPAGWATKEWMDFTLRIDTHAPWMKRETKTAHRQLRDRGRLALAHGAGHPRAALGTHPAADAERVALQVARLSVPF